MVMLTIATQNNGETVYFEDLIPKVHFIKLIPCSFYNSWHTLKNKGSAELGDRKVSLGKIPRTLLLDCFTNEIKYIFKTYGYD